MPDIINPNYDDAITDGKGRPSNEFFLWIDEITRLVNTLTPSIGSGSPEGVVSAETGKWYVDQDTVGTGIYLKETGSGNTGWVKRS